jgi:hypothetical protein
MKIFILLLFILYTVYSTFEYCDNGFHAITIKYLRPDPMTIYVGRSATFDVAGYNTGDVLSDGTIKLIIYKGWIKHIETINITRDASPMGPKWNFVYTRTMPSNIPLGPWNMRIELWNKDNVLLQCIKTMMNVAKKKN